MSDKQREGQVMDAKEMRGDHAADVVALTDSGESGALSRGASALIVVDMQNGFLVEGRSFSRMGCDIERLHSVIDPCYELVGAAQIAKVPTIFTRFVYQPGYADAGVTSRGLFPAIQQEQGLLEGSEDAEIVGELRRGSRSGFVIDKSRYSAFYGTRLLPLLTGLRVQTLVVCGITTSMCVESTVRDAAQRDYRTYVVVDATEDFSKERRDHSLSAMGYGFAWLLSSQRVISEWTRN